MRWYQPAESANDLMSLVLHDLREERRQRRKQSFIEAKRPRTPLQDVMAAAAVRSAEKAKLSTDTLVQLDAILTAAERMTLEWPKDTKRIADGLLLATLRLAWVKCTGKPSSDPEPDRIAMKMFQKHFIDKATMRRITAALKKTDNPAHVLDVCRALLVMMAS